MKHVQQLILSAITVLVASCSIADDAFRDEAHLVFHKTVVSYAPNYSRISKHTNSVMFWVEVLQEPIVREEWMLFAPEFSWTITPGKMGRDFTSMDGRFETMWFDEATDFGKSYTVKVKVKWTAIHENGQTQTSQSEFSFDIDAIKYDFDMACAGGNTSINGDPLVDNRAANVKVSAQGCSRPELLNLEMSSFPVKDFPLNKAGTDMDFRRVGQLEFYVPKTYWYGEQHPLCCYSYSNPYRVMLMSDYELECEKSLSVGMPDVGGDMDPVVKSGKFTLSGAQLLGDGRWRVSIDIDEYIKTAYVVVGTSQYKEESHREEWYHVDQFMGRVGIAEGGAADLFDVRQVYESLGIFSMQSRYLYSMSGEGLKEFLGRIRKLVSDKIEDELNESLRLWDSEEALQESRAKAHAGYNAAYMYHCCYEYIPKFGPESNLKPRQTRVLRGDWK